MKKAIIFDIDGTLADISHRLHYIQNGRRDYDAFYAACVDDKPKEDIIKLFEIINSDINFDYCHEDKWPYKIMFCTGRPEDYREQTVNWIHSNIVYAKPFEDHISLHMRPSGDHRPDYIIKQEMLNKFKEDGYEIIFTVDDRQQVVDMWRRNGITCLQVEQWDEKPKQTYAPGKLAMMVGPSGAGKSSWVNDQQTWFEEACVDTDNIRQLMCGDHTDQSQNDRVWSYAHAMIKANIEHGIDTVLDATNLRNRDRKAVLALVPENTEITYVVVDRPLEEKLATRGWRSEELIRRHDNLFRSNLRAILAGDDDPRVTVLDTRDK